MPQMFTVQPPEIPPNTAGLALADPLEGLKMEETRHRGTVCLPAPITFTLSAGPKNFVQSRPPRQTAHDDLTICRAA